MPDYTAQHARAGIDAKLPKIETWPNHFPGYDITIRFPEYTSVCPKTGLPDYGTITIQYQPNKLCLELKALKIVSAGLPESRIFYENAVNRMLRDISRGGSPSLVPRQRRIHSARRTFHQSSKPVGPVRTRTPGAGDDRHRRFARR